MIDQRVAPWRSQSYPGSPGVIPELVLILIPDELERRAMQAGDREAVTLGEVDLDHLDAVPLELPHDRRRAGVHQDLPRCKRDAVQREIPVLVERHLDDLVAA